MSGHSHWASIKHKKGLTDAKKGQAFSKLAKEITIAAKGGADPNFNPSLRIAIEKAKGINMPTDNIERAIKKGTGELAGEKLEESIFEAYGPGGIAVIIECISDNKNRALGEVKQILNRNNGKMVAEGAIKWMFERKGTILVDIKNQKPETKREDLELLVIEAGAEDVHWYEDILYIYSKPEELEKVRKSLEEKEVKIESASLNWVAKEELVVDEKAKESAQKLFDALDEADSVQEIYSNLKD